MDDKKPRQPIDERVDDPDAPATEEERVLSEQLRDALGDPSQKNEAAELARALSLGFAPRSIAEVEHRAIVERALAGAPARSNVVPFGPRRRARAGVVIGVATALSLAAGAIVVLGQMGAQEETAALRRTPRVQMVQTRSTQPLFEEPFARTGGASARIDRIAMARAGDLRENRFAKWGVK
jgi:hypothetical protein